MGLSIVPAFLFFTFSIFQSFNFTIFLSVLFEIKRKGDNLAACLLGSIGIHVALW